MAYESDLTVLTVVENDDGLLELMVKSVLKFTNPKPNFIICDNTNGKNKDRIKEAFGNYNNYQIVNNNPILQGGSNRHGDGLNKAFPMADSKYTAILDSDTCVLHKDWYKINSPLPVKATLKINGKNGKILEHTYHMCFFVFETDILRKNTKKPMDFRPGKDNNRINGQSYDVKYDVGWQICNQITQDRVELLKFRDCKCDGIVFRDIQCDEFHDKNNNIIATHFGRGSNLAGKKEIKDYGTHKQQVERWKDIVNEIINKG